MTPQKLDMRTEFINWRLKPTFGKVKTKPNAIGNLWKEIKKQEMPDYGEEDWLIKLSWIIEANNNKKLTIIRLISGDPLFTPLQKEVLQEIMGFLSNYYPHLNFHLCFTPTRELTKEKKQAVIKEAHSTHLGEKNPMEKIKTIGLWLGIENEIKKYVQSHPILHYQRIISGVSAEMRWEIASPMY